MIFTDGVGDAAGAEGRAVGRGRLGRGLAGQASPLGRGIGGRGPRGLCVPMPGAADIDLTILVVKRTPLTVGFDRGTLKV